MLARQRARQIAALLGFDAQDQTRIATAVSEIARNAFRVRRRRRGRVPRRGRDRAAALVDRRSATTAPASPNLDDGARRPLPLDDRHGARHRRRAAADGPLRHRDRRRAAAPRVDAGEAPAARRTRVDAARCSPRLADDARARDRRAAPLDEVQQQNHELLRTLAGAARAPGRARRGSTASSRTPTAASWRSTPSSTRRADAPAARRRDQSRGSSRT